MSKAKIKKIPKLTSGQKKQVTKKYLADMIQNKKTNKDWATLFPGRGGSSGGTYKGTRTGKQDSRWDVYGETADEELRHGELEELRHRCRQLVKDNPIAEGTVITFQEMVVGDGPFLRAKVTEDLNVEKEVQKFLDDWVLSCDVSTEKSLSQIVRCIVGDVCNNGDVLITLPMDESRKGVQTVINLIEADRISTPSGYESKPIRLGVQYAGMGAVEGYWVRKMGMTSDENKYGIFMNPTAGSYSFYPKSNNGRVSSWLFSRPSAIVRQGQSRQIPLLSTCIHILRQAEDLIDANVIGERVAACMMAAVKSSDVEGLVDSLTRDTDAKDQLQDKYGQRYGMMQPATILPLRAGEDIQMLNPQRAGNEANATVKNLMMQLSMKVRMPYAILFLDLKSINYSAYRGGIQESKRMLRGYRNQIHFKVIQPIVSTILYEALVKGVIKAPKQLWSKIMKPIIGWPAWGYLDPPKEVKAERDAIASGLNSHVRICQEHGLDAYEIAEEEADYLAHIKKLEMEKGIIFRTENKPESNTVPIPQEEDDDDEEGDKK